MRGRTRNVDWMRSDVSGGSRVCLVDGFYHDLCTTAKLAQLHMCLRA
jgi:hypothetical protein